MGGWIPFLPEDASTVAWQVDGLYLYISLLLVVFTTGVAVAITIFAVKYREREPFAVPRQIAGSLKLETLWTVVPFLIAMTIFAWGTVTYFTQYRPPADAMEITVVAKQWMWKFQHPTGQREINELHVPIGRRIRLMMTTEDTIHSLFVPAFRIKQDVVPGRYTQVWFEATKPGRYHLFCAEYCGLNHAGMGGYVEVMNRDDYDNWLAGNASQSPVAAGQGLFQSQGCSSCHGANGEGGRCPSLINLVGSEVQLDNGKTVTADEDYIRESILFPQAKIVAGYKPIMPTFQGQLNQEQLLNVIAYIKSLSPNATTAPAGTAPPASGGQSSQAAQGTGQGTIGGTGGRSLESQTSNPIGSTGLSNANSRGVNASRTGAGAPGTGGNTKPASRPSAPVRP